MGVSPFFATRGYDPIISVNPDIEVTDLRARHFAVHLDENHNFLREHMKDAQVSVSHTRTKTAWNPLSFVLEIGFICVLTIFVRIRPPAN